MLQINLSTAITVIRIAVAANMLIHGVFRMSTGGVVHFDSYLAGLGFPVYTAWLITFCEIAASLTIILGKWVMPLSLLFCLELLMGIVLVHWPEGWFVVGGGRNGMEYSVLMIVCFAMVGLSARRSASS